MSTITEQLYTRKIQLRAQWDILTEMLSETDNTEVELALNAKIDQMEKDLAEIKSRIEAVHGGESAGSGAAF